MHKNITYLVAKNFEHLQFTPTLILTPLIFLGGSFYSIEMLPKFWQLVSLFNPIVYLISGFRWAFLGFSDVDNKLADICIRGVLEETFRYISYEWGNIMNRSINLVGFPKDSLKRLDEKYVELKILQY